MKVGVPKEVKNHEYRVAITPSGVHELTVRGHEVLVEQDAGLGSSIPDGDYVTAGASIVPTADDVWATADLILKVKEPIPSEYDRMRDGQTLFTYLHLAASRECTDALTSRGVTGIAYETVQTPDGTTPLLAPMSEVAGRLAPQAGAYHLMRQGGGRGVLMGGVSGVYAAKVVVIGAGVSGMNAAAIALGMQAEVLLLDQKVTGIAYETVQTPDGALPLLAPMSEVAGRLATQAGAYHLMRQGGGRGVLMGGVSGVYAAKVVVIGAGVSGMNAAAIALGMQAEVLLLDRNIDKLREADRIYQGHLQTVASNTYEVERAVRDADLVIGAVLVPGAKAPTLVSNDLVSRMQPGAVLVDISIDQGGCFEDSRPTTHADPTYPVHDTVFYCVANMPGAVPHTSTYALTNVTLPYAIALADKGWEQAMRDDDSLALGLNTHSGSLTNAPVAAAHGQDNVPLAEVLG